jgi:hypothetical protein
MAKSPKRKDSNAEALYEEIATKLSEQMNVPKEDVLKAIRPELKKSDAMPPISLRLECTFRKLNSSTLEIQVAAIYLRDGAPRTTTLTRILSWDEVPADVRREFIHTGKTELHYSMGDVDKKEVQ